MTFDAQYLQLPRQGRGSALLMRFTVLILDFTAFICLCVNLGLFHKWAPKTQVVEITGLDYYKENTLIPPVHYWEDPIVIVAVLLSLIWTAFVYLRPAWTRKAFHPGAKIASELLLSVLILGCSIPAFVFSPLQPALSINTYQETDLRCVDDRSVSVHYYCGGWVYTLRALQKAAYALLWAVA